MSSNKSKNERTKSQICEDSGKQFSVHSHQSMCIQMHAREKPYKSNEYAYQQDEYNREKPYKCQECWGGCQEYIGEKPYKCKDCGKQFHQKTHLNKHARIYTSENHSNIMIVEI